MSLLSDLRFRMRALFQRRAMDGELEDELRFHFENEVEKHRKAGLSEEDARRRARLAFGGQSQVAEDCREARGTSLLDSVLRDARYALRQIRKSPGFAATVIGTLALGIGAAAAMFTVVDHVLLRPAPYRNAARLMDISEVNKSGKSKYPLPWLDIEQWQKQSREFEEIAFSAGMNGRTFLEQDKTAVEVGANQISANLLPTLGVQPMLGRGFLAVTPSFAPDKNAGTVVLSYAAWQAMGGRRSILGRTVRINEQPWTVVGVMPMGFRYPAESYGMAQVWMPIELGEQDEARDYTANSYQVIGRLRPGVSMAAAQAEIGTIQQRLAPEWESRLRGDHSRVRLERYTDTLAQADVRKALEVLLAAAGVLWLIASLNATNLLLARGTARQREIAMRRALGAGPWRIGQQVLVEGTMMSVAAGALGIGLAMGAVKLLAHEIALRLPLPVPVRPDGWILVVLLGMTAASALLSAAWPAWMAASAPMEPALKRGGVQTGQSRSHHRMRGALVALEIAMSLTLLMGCGLLLRTIYDLRQVPLKFRTDHIVVANLAVPAYRYANQNMTTGLYQPLLERVQHLHGIESAGLMTQVPLENTFRMWLRTYTPGGEVNATMEAVTPGVEQVFDFPMAAGRFFNADDTPTSRLVVVVNQAFAQDYSPDKHNPAAVVGTKLMGTARGTGQPDYAEVVGILDDVHQVAIGSPSTPEVEVSLAQIGPASTFYNVLDGIAMDLAVRTQLPEEVIVPELRDVLRQASPELAGAKITTMNEVVEDSYGSQTLAAHLLEIFGGSALLLCVTGLYGLLAYVVTQRTREIGVRIALGATRNNVLWLVLRQAGMMLLVGVVVGSGLALASGRLARGFLYGVRPHDGWTLAGAAALLFLCGMLASYVPARRAAAVDPMEALRSE